MADEQSLTPTTSQELSSSGDAISLNTTPQFSTAEYAHIPGTERCRLCNNLLSQEYYRVNGLLACQTCAEEAHHGQPKDSHVAFSRGLTFGIGAAFVGMIIYAAFTIVTGWYLGYIALGVGYLVAKAIKKGSHGLGGRRYQIAAVLLTYAAISIAAIPIEITYAMKAEKAKAPAQVTRDSASNSATPNTTEPSQGQTSTKLNIPALLFQLVLMGLASPFLELQDPFHGLIGLVILFVGLRIAWRLTASTRLEVDGPYTI